MFAEGRDKVYKVDREIEEIANKGKKAAFLLVYYSTYLFFNK